MANIFYFRKKCIYLAQVILFCLCFLLINSNNAQAQACCTWSQIINMTPTQIANIDYSADDFSLSDFNLGDAALVNNLAPKLDVTLASYLGTGLTAQNAFDLIPNLDPNMIPTVVPNILDVMDPNFNPLLDATLAGFDLIPETIANLSLTQPAAVISALIPNFSVPQISSFLPILEPDIAADLLPDLTVLQFDTIIPTLDQTLINNLTTFLDANTIAQMIPILDTSIVNNLISGVLPNLTPDVINDLLPALDPTVLTNLVPNLDATLISNLDITMISDLIPTLDPAVLNDLIPNLTPDVLFELIPDIVPSLDPAAIATLMPSLDPATIANIAPNIGNLGAINPFPSSIFSANTSCTNTGADLTGYYSENPCAWTRDTVSFAPAQMYRGGEQIRNDLENWWQNSLLPDFNDMIAQLNTGIVDQTRIIGSLIDGQNQIEAQRALQEKELEANRRYHPSEISCQVGTVSAALTTTAYTSQAIAKAISYDSRAREFNMPGTTTEDGPAADHDYRWGVYEDKFCDPSYNNGSAGCLAANGNEMINGDINIEQFLFRDTINLSDAGERDAAIALLRNLVETKAYTPIPAEALNSLTGKEAFLMKRHLSTLRQLAVSTVSGIIGRRASVQSTVSAPGLTTPIGTHVRAIRERAGIPTLQTSLNPSYNEIMLAMTKERFFNPEYYMRLGDNPGALKQEQTVLDSLITMQLQDIYDMQEQMNTLMAARTSIKLNKAQPSSHFGASPTQ